MTDQALQWLEGLPDMTTTGVPGVPGVPSQKCAGFAGTHLAPADVPGVPGTIPGTSGTPGQTRSVPRKPAENLAEHLEHPEHLRNAHELEDLTRGVQLLCARPRHIADLASDWLQVMTDAQQLIDRGIAGQALALGWDGYDLFGIGGGDGEWAVLSVSRNEWLSLAVWVAGRTIVMLDDQRAFTMDGQIYHRERFGRPSTVFQQPIYLWEWGK